MNIYYFGYSGSIVIRADSREEAEEKFNEIDPHALAENIDKYDFDEL